jgi:hypothetical protein
MKAGSPISNSTEQSTDVPRFCCRVLKTDSSPLPQCLWRVMKRYVFHLCHRCGSPSVVVILMRKKQYSGQYHSHPYGEINCVVQVGKTAELKGMQGWQGAGWTSPGPGTHHYPEVRGGALIALFFLPAGRISYRAKPGDPQPASV